MHEEQTKQASTTETAIADISKPKAVATISEDEYFVDAYERLFFVPMPDLNTMFENGGATETKPAEATTKPLTTEKQNEEVEKTSAPAQIPQPQNLPVNPKPGNETVNPEESFN